MERCMEKLLMLKLDQLEIVEGFLDHQSEKHPDVFKGLARKAHDLYKEMERALALLKTEHERLDRDMDKAYADHRLHGMYHAHHMNRASGIERRVHGRA